FAVGKLVVWFLKQLEDDYLVITVAVIAGWIAYIAGEMVEVSGVIATVTAGMIVGWHQHEVFSAAVRTRGTAFWQVIVFLLEAMVFVLIGLSLRGAIHRLGGFEQVLATMVPPMLAVLAAVIVSRFVWIYAVEALKWPVRGIARRGEAPDWKAATIMSWAGMRGVVTLAIALSLPEAMPGRDVILVASFAVILVTVLLQGTTIGPLIRLLRLPQRVEREAHHLTEPQTWAYVEAAQLAAIQPLVRDENGVVIHPRLLEQYTYRAELTERAKDEPAYPAEVRTAHYDVVLAAIRAGRAELLRLHRSGHIHDEMLHALERDLDLQEVSAQHARG
ncbi:MULTISPECIES: sodium:proton antiporter, partial [unclassified Burkholderia]